MRLLGLVFLVLAITQAAHAENFSCRMGTQAACLDYGDKVCSSYSKCVDQNASCFESYQCDYEGFTCKSNVTKCFAGYEEVARKHDDLVGEYNDLLRKQRELADEYDALVGRYNTLLRKRNEMAALYDDSENALENLRNCVRAADNLAEAENCSFY